ncbi:hypothetical protein NFI96_023315 [Prochilodus magdalenae]|nr:hypothetical protein NFI96_023315 [Prochilodus magdalenae]
MVPPQAPPLPSPVASVLHRSDGAQPRPCHSHSTFKSATQALAASGGQPPISSLEGGAKVLIGGSGGQRSGLPSSLFLNHPSLLPMAASMGLGNSAIPKSNKAVFLGGTSPSPCSSPASSCSSSDLLHSPPLMGGAKIE